MDKLDWFSPAKMTAGLVLLSISGTLNAGMPVAADEHGLEVSGAYMQTTIPSRPAAGYFNLKNNGDVDLVLVGASSPGCESTMMHKRARISGLRHQVDIVHKQRVNPSLAEGDDRVGGRADDWLAVVEGRIDDDRHTGSREKAGYKLVKARI